MHGDHSILVCTLKKILQSPSMKWATLQLRKKIRIKAPEPVTYKNIVRIDLIEWICTKKMLTCVIHRASMSVELT